MIDLEKYSGKGNFFFLRHGESAGNVAHVAQGRADFPLTEKGKKQAARAGRWFEEKEIDLILSSPLLRASETAEIVARETGIGRVQIREELIEIEIGLFSGLNWDEAAARYPQVKRQFGMHNWDGVPGAEKADEIYGRAEKVWELVLQNGAKNILAVTHSGLLQWIIKVTLGHKSWLPLFPMRNCSVFQFVLNNRIVPPDKLVDIETPAYYYRWELLDFQV